MNRGLRIFLITLGILIMLVPGIIITSLSEEIVTGEQLCVDGNYNINLDGIMCEETVSAIPGFPSKYSSMIQWLSVLIGFIIYVWALFAKVSNDEVKA